MVYVAALVAVYYSPIAIVSLAFYAGHTLTFISRTAERITMSKPTVRSLQLTLTRVQNINEALTTKLREKDDAVRAYAEAQNVLRAKLEASERARRELTPEPLRAETKADAESVQQLRRNPHLAWLRTFVKDQHTAAAMSAENCERMAAQTNSIEHYGLLRESRARMSALAAVLAIIDD